MKNRSLQSRLLVGLLIGCAAVLAVGSVVLYVTQRKLMYQEFDRELYRASRGFLARRMPRFGRGPRTQPAATLPEGIDAYQVYREEATETHTISRHGRDRDRSPSGPKPKDRDWSPPKVVSAGPVTWKDVVALPSEPKDSPVYFDLVLPDGRLGRAQAFRMTIPGPPVWPSGGPGRGGPPGHGPGGRRSWRGMKPGEKIEIKRLWYRVTTIAAASTEDLRAALARLGWTIAAGAAGGMVVLGLLAVTVVRLSLRPLRPLASEIASLGQDNLGRPISTKRLPAEIVPVVDRLNELLGRLGEAFQREQAFTANVAHELRTPLAGIRSTAEVSLRHPRSAQEYAQALARMLSVTEGLQNLVEKLLQAGRIDAGEVAPQRQRRLLRPDVDRQWQSLVEQAERRDLTFRNEIPGDLACQVDPVLLETILANVLANAVQYADKGGTISAAGRNGEVMARLTVTNPAHELSADDVDKVLDRFWRKEAARSATGVHFGLGLSLVQRCAAVQGGRVTAELTDGNEFVLHVDLPAGVGDGEDPPADKKSS